MHRSDRGKWRAKTIACASILALSVFGFGSSAQAQADLDKAVDKIKTETPIKHVIIIVGENRSFDHLFATYKPKDRHERVLNLLSERIINEDGSPGPNFSKAHQFKISLRPQRRKILQQRGPGAKATLLDAARARRGRRWPGVALSSRFEHPRWQTPACHPRTNSCSEPGVRVWVSRWVRIRASQTSTTCRQVRSR